MPKKDQSVVGAYNDNSYDVRDEAPCYTSDVIDGGSETNCLLKQLESTNTQLSVSRRAWNSCKEFLMNPRHPKLQMFCFNSLVKKLLAR